MLPVRNSTHVLQCLMPLYEALQSCFIWKETLFF